MKINTTWEYSLDTEAERILHIAHQMSAGFFRVNNFYVLPLHYKTTQQASFVKFPDLPFNTIPRFWKKAKQLNIYSWVPLINNKGLKEKKVFEKIKALLKNCNLPEPSCERIKQKWDKASPEIFDEID